MSSAYGPTTSSSGTSPPPPGRSGAAQRSPVRRVWHKGGADGDEGLIVLGSFAVLSSCWSRSALIDAPPLVHGLPPHLSGRVPCTVSPVSPISAAYGWTVYLPLPGPPSSASCRSRSCGSLCSAEVLASVRAWRRGSVENDSGGLLRVVGLLNTLLIGVIVALGVCCPQRAYRRIVTSSSPVTGSASSCILHHDGRLRQHPDRCSVPGLSGVGILLIIWRAHLRSPAWRRRRLPLVRRILDPLRPVLQTVVIGFASVSPVGDVHRYSPAWPTCRRGLPRGGALQQARRLRGRSWARRRSSSARHAYPYSVFGRAFEWMQGNRGRRQLAGYIEAVALTLFGVVKLL